MNIEAMGVQQQVQTAILAKTMQGNSSEVLQMLAQLEQTNQAIAQSMNSLSSGHVDVTV